MWWQNVHAWFIDWSDEITESFSFSLQHGFEMLNKKKRNQGRIELAVVLKLLRTV